MAQEKVRLHVVVLFWGSLLHNLISGLIRRSFGAFDRNCRSIKAVDVVFHNGQFGTFLLKVPNPKSKIEVRLMP